MTVEIDTPLLTVDMIIRVPLERSVSPDTKNGIVLIKRKNPPYGWALPGGFVDVGESLEDAVKREMLEETSLNVTNLRQFHAYSNPDRDPRGHTVSVIFTGEADRQPVARDDAAEARVFTEDDLPQPIAFDHTRILKDYFNGGGRYD